VIVAIGDLQVVAETIRSWMLRWGRKLKLFRTVHKALKLSSLIRRHGRRVYRGLKIEAGEAAAALKFDAHIVIVGLSASLTAYMEPSGF
jgi:hypothetical protein